LEKQFALFLHDFIKKYKVEIFNDMRKCKSLLLDHAKGEHKKEIRLLLQALDMGCYSTIMNSNDLNITRMTLIKQLQDEYYISEDIATSFVDLLLLELRNYKTVQTNQTNKTKQNKSNPSQQSNQTKPNQLPANNNKKPIFDTKFLSEIDSIITTRNTNRQLQIERCIERYKDKVKNVYELAFKEYQEILSGNNLKSDYIVEINGISSYKHPKIFYFLFVGITGSYLSIHPMYRISKMYFDHDFVIVEKIFPDIFKYPAVVGNYKRDDCENKRNTETKRYNIEDLTKEIIMQDLTEMTNQILKKIKEQINTK